MQNELPLLHIESLNIRAKEERRFLPSPGSGWGSTLQRWMKISISEASPEEKLILRNLMELCQYDHSEITGANVNSFGLFDYTHLDHYWTDPLRHPFLVRVENKLAGFVLVDQEGESYNMVELFILRTYRHHGLGEVVAHQIFDLFPGKWRIQQNTDNPAMQTFWRKVIARYTNNHYRELHEEKTRRSAR